MKQFSAKIITPEGIVFDQQVVSIIAPGEKGYLGIWHNHSPIIAKLKAGVITCEEEDSKRFFAIDGGILEVEANCNLLILCDTAEPAEKYEKAKELIQKTA